LILEGPWIEGNIFIIDFSKKRKEWEAEFKKSEVGVKQPTALRTKEINGVDHSQYYYKPWTREELLD